MMIYRLRRKLLKFLKSVIVEISAFSFYIKIIFFKPCEPDQLIVLILDSERYPYSVIKKKGNYPTWGTDFKKQGVSVFYYYGDKTENIIKGDTIMLKYPDSSYTEKFIGALELITHLFNDQVYLLRTNSSSYWRVRFVRKLVAYLKYKKIDYFGVQGFDYETKQRFASGAGFFLSSRVVDEIIKSDERMDTSLIDDVALGKFLQTRGYKLFPGYRLDLNKQNWLIKASFLSFYHYHFRCKTKTNHTKERLLDISKMQFLHRLFNIY